MDGDVKEIYGNAQGFEDSDVKGIYGNVSVDETCL